MGSPLIEQPTFGRRVRKLRLVRGLTQAQVAGDGMSTSYVSLVESGRRTPSAEIAEQIAERLNVSLADLATPDEDAQQRSRRVALVGRLVAARTATACGDHTSARAQLLAIISDATASRIDEAAWEARWELAEVHGHLGDEARRGEVLRDLLEDPLTTDSVLLHTRVSVALSEVARRCGQLTDSMRWAEHAVAGAVTLEPTAPERIMATLVLLSAYADSGAWEPARMVAAELLEIIDDIEENHLAGLACWAAGAVYFFADQAEAASLFDRALSLLDPAANLRLWGRLCRSAAAHQVATGNLAAAGSLLDRATGALNLVGTPADRALVAEVRLAARLRAGELAYGSGEADLDLELPGLSTQDQARCLVLRARIARMTSRLSESAATYQQAASQYEAAGAYRLATEVWREYAELTSGGGPAPPARDHHALVMP